MLAQSAATLAIAYLALAVLGFLSAVRIRSIWTFRRTDPERFHRAFPSWAASLCGVLAILSLGLVVPLESIDAVLGGTNIANLVQSTLTVLGVWFFRESVREVVFDHPKRLSRLWLVAHITAFAIPFFLIADRGTTSTEFMAENAHDIANIAYNVIYMGGLTWILVDMIWTLRKQPRGAYAVFLAGLCIVALSTIDEIVYIATATFTPEWFSTFTHDAFYGLFFGGILTILIGWTWVLIVERDYLGRLRFRFDSLRLAALMLRIRRRGRHEILHRPTDGSLPPAADILHEEKHAERATKPRLLVKKYRSGESDRRSAIQVLATDSGLDVVVGLLGANSEEVAYRLVILIRNVLTRYDQTLTAREERIVARVEDRYPGYEPAGALI